VDDEAGVSQSTGRPFAGGLRGYLRLQDVPGFAGLWLRQDVNWQTLSLENMQAQHVSGTREWSEYRIALPINPKAEQLYFGVLVSGTGTLWADDLELLVDGKPIAQAASAPPDLVSLPTMNSIPAPASLSPALRLRRCRT
jgi:hypothetical protein